ncbi:MAG: 5-nucleotidase SurE (EC [uncultured Campylobacterales bacterium]|uniref:5'-nucleotidase SurE n=1 Tax=uncultured Campylobacterales bacterium TaxID=352960 RepID=A0A6S6SMF7_9BACT|nr:MAG: 5-nucleotidase SurE (EC [uncultured Campylobacterales bacterium]
MKIISLLGANKTMKTILITNDDGYDASGILALKDALSEVAKVAVVAPAFHKSATAHSLTITKPLKLIEIANDFYKLEDGTPADCVYVALNTIFKDIKPDLIVSGINIGANMGEDITYSGTAGAAMEGVLHDIPSLAISQVFRGKRDTNYDLAKKSIKDIVSRILNGNYPLGKRELLNINIPPISIDEFKGYKVVHAGCRGYDSNIEYNTDPRGQKYYWIGLPNLSWYHRYEEDTESDFQAIEDGYVALTPVTLDMTSYKSINRVKEWLNEIR